MDRNKVVKARIASVEAALKAGFIPDGSGLLKSGSGKASISQANLERYADTMQVVKTTGHDEYPATYNGTIFHKDLISLETKSAKYTRASNNTELTVTAFDDGSLGITDNYSGTNTLVPSEVLEELFAKKKASN